MNNEIKLKNGAVVKLIDKDITGEQHMDVKKTYVATTKKEIVAKGIKYYQDKLNSAVMDKPEVESIDITPITNVPMTEVPPVVEETVSSQLSEVDNTIPNTVEETKDEMPTVEEITKQAPLYTDEPVKAEIESVPETPVTLEQDTPYSVPTEEPVALTPVPEENSAPTPSAEEPFFNTMNITLPSEGLTSSVESIPTPEPSVEPIPEVNSMANATPETPLAAPSLPNEEPKVESVETPAEPLNFNIPTEPVVPTPTPMPGDQERPVPTPLAEEPFFNTMNITLPSEGLTSSVESAPTPEPISQPTVDTPNPFNSISVETETPTVEPISLGNQEPVVFDASKENNLLNALSDKTVEASNKAMLLNDDSLNNVRDFGGEPTKVNYQPNVRKAGFVNSKLLTVISILFFLASCGFLVYEIFNFINAKK